MVDLCTCAIGIESAPAASCSTCATGAVVPGAHCFAQAQACTASGACATDLACKKGCNGDAACIAACLFSPSVSKEYVDYLTCTCGVCNSACPPPAGVTCPSLDGGTDGDAASD